MFITFSSFYEAHVPKYLRKYHKYYYYNTYVEVDAQVWANLNSSRSIFRARNFTSGPDLAYKKLAGQTKLRPWSRNDWKIRSFLL